MSAFDALAAVCRNSAIGAGVLALVVLLGCASVASGGSDTKTPAVPKQLRERQIIVTLADATPQQWADTAQALGSAYRLQEVGNFPLSSIRVQCLVYEIAGERRLEDVVDELKKDPRVESVQVNQVFQGVRGAHSDPYAAMAYGADAIRAPLAHRVATGKGVKVVIIDTGVDRDHPDLRGRFAKTVNFVEGGEKTYAQDLHGTAVAGLIGARADDGVGIYGIAPEAEMSAAKACWYDKSKKGAALCSSWTLAKALDFALDADARVVNMSLTGPPDELLRRLLKVADERGIVVVAAAAQNETEPGFPASLASVVAVLASDAKGAVQAPAWSLDKQVLAAPGVDVLTTAPRDSYDFLSGSSLAAAHVTGAVALVLQHKQRLSGNEVAQLLTSTAKPVATQTRSLGAVFTVIDACAAVGKLLGRADCR